MVSARWPFPAFFSPTIRAALSADAVLVRLVRARWLYGVEPFFVLSPIGNGGTVTGRAGPSLLLGELRRSTPKLDTELAPQYRYSAALGRGGKAM